VKSQLGLLQYYAAAEVLTAVTMKGTIFGVITPWSSEKAQLSACFCQFLAWLTLWLWSGADIFVSNVGPSPKRTALQSRRPYYSYLSIILPLMMMLVDIFSDCNHTKIPRGGELEYLHRNPASRRRRWKGNGAWGYNWAILWLGDINTVTCSLRREEGGLDTRLTISLRKKYCCEHDGLIHNNLAN
jgi:hypothetical protein